MLLDPIIAIQGETEETVDDDYGMVKVIKRIREWPDGEEVPITLVLTKYDQHRSLIKSEGGLVQFVKKWYPNLVMASGGKMKLYAPAAVFTRNLRQVHPLLLRHQPFTSDATTTTTNTDNAVDGARRRADAALGARGARARVAAAGEAR